MKLSACYPVLAAACLLHAGSALAQSRSELDERLLRVERAVDSSGLVELLAQVEALQTAMQHLQGQIETQTYTLEQMQKQQRELYQNLDQRVQALETVTIGLEVSGEPPLSVLDATSEPGIAGTPVTDNALSVEITNAPAAATTDPASVLNRSDLPQLPATPGDILREDFVLNQPPGAAPADTVTDSIITPAAEAPATVAAAPIVSVRPATTPPPDRITVDSPDSEAAYQAAFDLLKTGSYEPAIAGFREYLAQFPQSQHVDNAQYWIGESYYVMRQFEPAVAEYQRLIDMYPDSARRSHAMLKLGYSYYELGQRDLSRAVLEDLKANFPATTAARLADERIQRMALDTPR